jgi:hypothetical protein
MTTALSLYSTRAKRHYNRHWHPDCEVQVDIHRAIVPQTGQVAIDMTPLQEEAITVSTGAGQEF